MPKPANLTIDLLRFILRPVARFCLRHTLHLQDLIEAVKAVLVEEAQRLTEQKGEKVNVSRLSVLTGMHRRDVMRIFRDAKVNTQPQGLLNRIIGQWQYDKRYCGGPGKPRALSCDGEGSEFHSLVRSLSTDINPGTVAFELEQLALARRHGAKISLKRRVFMPLGRAKEGFAILEADLNDLALAVEENVLANRVVHLHGRTAFDNIRSDALPEVRRWLVREGSNFHKRVRDYLSRLDLDLNPATDAVRGGARVAVGAFSYSVDGGHIASREVGKSKGWR